MARKTKDCKRSSLNGFFDSEMASQHGELFAHPDGSIWDSSQIKVIHHGIDTIKQLYQGLVDMDMFDSVQKIYDAGVGNEIEIDGYKWRVGSGRRGGYRYSLNCRDLGLFVLFGSFYTEPNYHGHHLKIECSPNFILLRTVDEIQNDLDNLAKVFISQVLCTNCAIHICADVQGWVPEHDLDRCMVTKAKRVFKASGASEAVFENHAIAYVWGRGETFTFGSVDALQFSVYDKGKEANDTGDLDFWVQKWQLKQNAMFKPVYDPEKPVTRLEARYHHSVIAQFARGMSLDLRSFKAVSEHLTGLWRYALTNFRLDASPTYIDPFWQFMRDDLIFFHDAKAIEYKRSFKKPDDAGLPSDRSIMICFGQLAAIYGKNKYSISKAIGHLMQSGIWSNLCSLYVSRGKDQDDVLIDLEFKMSRFVS